MITQYTGQSNDIADIFHTAIHQTAAGLYTPEQLDAWAPSPIDYSHWRARCELKRPFVFKVDERTAGFIELDNDGHIDCHYVHPDFNRQGIGGQLLQYVVSVAKSKKLDRLYVEASHVAKGLYLRHGFDVVRKNIASRQGIELENWIMERRARTDRQ